MEPAILVHGGVGQPSSHSDGTMKAAKAAMEILLGGGSAMDAVVKAVVMLEDDERFNAGTGSRLRLDGSIQMDAIVCDSRGHIGAVAAISGVKNPVLVARKVADTPQRLLAGEGAVKFARRVGFHDYDPTTAKNRERLGRYKQKLASGDMPAWLGDWGMFRDLGHDTIGAIAVDRRNTFAIASSSGGTSVMLPGRVGDVPLYGCGLYVGKEGAVACTGVGEFIIDKVLALQVYYKLVETSAKEAADWGVALYPKHIPTGILTISKEGWGISANKYMACTVITWDTTLSGDQVWPPEESEEEPASEITTVAAPTYPPMEQPAEVQQMPPAPPPAVQQPMAPPPVTPPPPVEPTPAPAPAPASATEPTPEPAREPEEEPAPPPQELIDEGPPKEEAATQPQAPPPTIPPPLPPQTQAPPPTQPPQEAPRKAVEPAKPPEQPQKFRCPYCQQVFSVIISHRPITVSCPHCSQHVMIQ